MSKEMPVAFLVQRIGPYHHARLSAWAAARSGPITVIEFRPEDSVYAWEAVESRGNYERVQTRSAGEIRDVLQRVKPQAVVCVGYADPEVHDAMAWAMENRIPLVTCSDSTRADERRSWWKERCKRSVVLAFDAALVAGSRARSYLDELGIPAERCFAPWDVVDNVHFELGAGAARREPEAWRARLKLPHSYFLCVARFVLKKNLERLVEAYARYVNQAGESAWHLVLSGSGPLENSLRANAAAFGVEARVHFVGFLQYHDLPACYGLAGALVLPSLSDQWGLVVNEAMAAALPVLVSTSCGCGPELVHERETGFTFDPHDSAAITRLLGEIASMSAAEREAMGRCARTCVASVSPDAFSHGVEAAVGCALARPRKAASWLTRRTLGVLTSRPLRRWASRSSPAN